MVRGKGSAAITFKNGIQINVRRNGDCFYTDGKPEFPSDLSLVIITGIDDEWSLDFIVREYMETLHNTVVEELPAEHGQYVFAFHELSPEELREKELNDTIQMLTDCLLEMSELLYS